MEEKVDVLRSCYPRMKFDLSKSNEDFQISFQSDDKTKLEAVLKKVKQWTVFTKSNYIKDLESIQKENYKKTFIEIDQKNSQVTVYSFEKEEVDKILKDLVHKSEDLKDKKSYCCLISNIPNALEKGQIKKFFNDNGMKFGHVQSINIKLNDQHGTFQCFINYPEEDSANKATKYFRNFEYNGNKLYAKSLNQDS